MKTLHSKKGFTLIELLVVISIVSLLSSIILSTIKIAREKSVDAAAIRNLTQLKSALALYYDRHGEYPPSPTGTSDDLWSERYGLTCWDCPGVYVAIDSGKLSSIAEFIPSRPVSTRKSLPSCDDLLGFGYFYKTSPSGQGYKLALGCAADYENIPLSMRDNFFGIPYTASIYEPETAKTWGMYTPASDLIP